MGKTITLSDPYITSLNIDLEKNIVKLLWRVDLPSGQKYQNGEFVFYRTAPTDMIIGQEEGTGNPIYGVPDTWAALPIASKSALTTLVTLATDFLGNQDI